MKSMLNSNIFLADFGVDQQYCRSGVTAASFDGRRFPASSATVIEIGID
jgi:hypothetical protein